MATSSFHPTRGNQPPRWAYFFPKHIEGLERNGLCMCEFFFSSFFFCILSYVSFYVSICLLVDGTSTCVQIHIRCLCQCASVLVNDATRYDIRTYCSWRRNITLIGVWCWWLKQRHYLSLDRIYHLNKYRLRGVVVQRFIRLYPAFIPNSCLWLTAAMVVRPPPIELYLSLLPIRCVGTFSYTRILLVDNLSL